MKKINEWYLILKPFLKPFLVVFLIYCFAMLAVLRAGVSFTDDQRRAITGGAWLTDFHRYSSTAFGLLINMNDRLLDISPYPQILAMAILSIVSVIVTYVFCNKNIKYLPLILTMFIGLLPLTVECWLYKFDAPCIALSLLVSVLPILWWPRDLKRKSLIQFGLISLVCMLIMWTTYQAASGVFLVLCLYMALRDYLNEGKVLVILKKFGVAIIAFLVAVVLFKCLPEPTWSYREIGMFKISELISGVLVNLMKYLEMMVRGLNVYQMILAGMAIVGVGILVFLKYKLKGFLILLVFLMTLPLSIGAFLLLKEPSLTSRSLVGVGMAFAPILVLVTKDLDDWRRSILVVPSLVLLYSFMMFVLALGNGLADQDRWANYRVENLVSELSELYPSENEIGERTVFIYGDIGYSAVMQHVANKYPATRQMITIQQTGLSEAVWGLKKLTDYYGRDTEFVRDAGRDYCGLEVDNLRADTYYFTIRDNSEFVCIDLK